MRKCILAIIIGLLLISCSSKIKYNKEELLRQGQGIVVGRVLFDVDILNLKNRDDIDKVDNIMSRSPFDYSFLGGHLYKVIKSGAYAMTEGVFLHPRDLCSVPILGGGLTVKKLACITQQGTKENPKIALFYLEPGEIIYIGTQYVVDYEIKAKSGNVLEIGVIDEYDNLIQFLKDFQPEIAHLIKKRLFKFVDRPKECKSYTLDYKPTKEEKEKCRLKLLELYGDKKF